ncbi:hypothetical protein KSB_26540 [Ktedonobacter robiniae]|uniref:Transposase n=1 Tax=Ktedonobacter robiniae TaxID=2778365 RepID=A0ABQ3UN95_9CHLR|nr:hypothetical protein KSB_26540 [Ktedonobacter robiniae]
MTGKRKQYDPEFKLKVVMESFQRETTLEEVCRLVLLPMSRNQVVQFALVLHVISFHCLVGKEQQADMVNVWKGRVIGEGHRLYS